MAGIEGMSPIPCYNVSLTVEKSRVYKRTTTKYGLGEKHGVIEGMGPTLL